MSCTLKLDSTCSSGPIESYAWIIDPGESFGGPSTSSKPQVNRSFPQCAGETVQVTLAVGDAAGASRTLTRSIVLPGGQMLRTGRARTSSFVVALVGAENSTGVVRTREGVALRVRGGAVASYRFRTRGTVVEVEAQLERTSGEVSWEFDFAGGAGFVPGSLRVLEGSVLVREPYRVVLRLASPGERARFRYRLRP